MIYRIKCIRGLSHKGSSIALHSRHKQCLLVIAMVPSCDSPRLSLDIIVLMYDLTFMQYRSRCKFVPALLRSAQISIFPAPGNLRRVYRLSWI